MYTMRKLLPNPDRNKKCKKCGLTKSYDEFARQTHRDPLTNAGYTFDCKMCRADYQRARNASLPPRAMRLYHLNRTYGLSETEYDQLIASQNGNCPICLKLLEDDCDLDHDHSKCQKCVEFGARHEGHHERRSIRGVLHHRCNFTVLGLVENNIQQIRNALAYLDRT